MKETGVPGKNHRPVASHWQTLSHTVVLIAQIVGFTYEHNHPTWFDYWITNIIINTHSFAVSSATCTIIKELKYYCYYWYSSLQYEMQVWSGQYSPIGFIFIIEDSICGFLIVQADWCHKGKTNKSSTYMSEWVIIVSSQMSHFSVISWREQVTINEMMMSAIYYTNSLTGSWIILVLAHCNSILLVGRHVVPLEHVILIPSQPVFDLSP